MEHGANMTSLMIVIGIAFFIPILLHRLKLNVIPVVVAEIIAGIIIGQSGLNIIDFHDPWLELLSMLGLIYLMFLSGVEIDFSSFKSKKKGKKANNPFLTAVFIFLLMTVLSVALSIVLKKMGLVDDVLFMTIILSTISLGVVVPVLKERGLLETPLGQTTLLTAVVSDFATMLLFAYYLAVKSGNVEQLYWLVLLLVAVVVLYYVLRFFHQDHVFKTLQEGTSQLGTRGVFALILFFVSLSETLGAENILGAFLAGVIISLLAPKKEFIHQLDSFGYGFLIPIFFVMVGVKLNLKELFTDTSVFLVIPVVLFFLFVARALPVLILKRWYSWNETLSSAFILTSTMSLAIVAASIAAELGFISEILGGAIVLVSILSCFLSPILFNKILPRQEARKKKVTIIGANMITLPVSLDLAKLDTDVTIFTLEQGQNEHGDEHHFPIVEVEDLSFETLEERNAFDCDTIVVSTSDDDVNSDIAQYAQKIGVNRVIVRIEQPDLHEKMIQEGFGVFSSLYSTRILLRLLVNYPSLVRFLTQENDTLGEVYVKNHKYDGVKLRQFPLLGDTLILQIYRHNEAIVPHGDTKIQYGDILIVSGSDEHIVNMKKELR